MIVCSSLHMCTLLLRRGLLVFRYEYVCSKEDEESEEVEERRNKKRRKRRKAKKHSILCQTTKSVRHARNLLGRLAQRSPPPPPPPALCFASADAAAAACFRLYCHAPPLPPLLLLQFSGGLLILVTAGLCWKRHFYKPDQSLVYFRERTRLESINQQYNFIRHFKVACHAAAIFGRTQQQSTTPVDWQTE
jgi:hypothetical protein